MYSSDVMQSGDDIVRAWFCGHLSCMHGTEFHSGPRDLYYKSISPRGKRQVRLVTLTAKLTHKTKTGVSSPLLTLVFVEILKLSVQASDCTTKVSWSSL